MKRSIVDGIAAAAAITVISAPIWLLLVINLGRWLGGTLTVALAGALYLWHVLNHVGKRPGRVLILVIFVPALIGCTMIHPFPMSILALTGVFLVISRSWFHYKSLISVAADALLCVLSVQLAAVSLVSGFGVLGAIWMFLLVQSISALDRIRRAAERCRERLQLRPV